MSGPKLPTDSYKGVRDFYPADMAIQRYIFETWAKTAESFGFERYDASILEPSDLYKAKGAENEEMVNEQTYTFTDRGDREVTLRPEMTPTVARMVAGKRRELQFPLRWYSIPNLFRYERPQRGRLREHWQLNCDIFGSDDIAADIEIIALAAQVLKDCGASDDMFEIRINDRREMREIFKQFGVTGEEKITAITRLNDRFHKISKNEYLAGLQEITGNTEQTQSIFELVNAQEVQSIITKKLKELGINNVVVDRSLARGFDYYTGTIFEIFDKSDENNRSMLGGGRYDNLTSMFGGEPISGVGFGMGDVTMRDFLETHNLIPDHLTTTAAKVVIIPMAAAQNLFAEQVAHQVRQTAKISVTTDIGTKKVGDKISRASERGSTYIVVIGESEVQSGILTIKNLLTRKEHSGKLTDIITTIT